MPRSAIHALSAGILLVLAASRLDAQTWQTTPLPVTDQWRPVQAVADVQAEPFEAMPAVPPVQTVEPLPALEQPYVAPGYLVPPPELREPNLWSDPFDPSTVPAIVDDYAIDDYAIPPRKGPPLGPFGGGSPFRTSGFWASSAKVDGQNTELGMNAQSIDGALPIGMPTDQNIWLALGKFKRLELDTAAVLPDSGIAIPNQLWNYGLGLMHGRELANGWQAGGMLMLTSPSDKPWGEGRDIVVTTLGFVVIPARNGRDAWNLSLYYSPASQLPYPLPGVAYAWRPSPQLQADLGLPFSLTYRPTEAFTFSASYVPLTTVNILARQRLGQAWSLYGGYKIVNDSYFLSERTDDSEQFFLFDQRALVGIDCQLGYGFLLDFSAAYLFDRQIFQSTDFASGRHDELRLDPAAALTLSLSWSR